MKDKLIAKFQIDRKPISVNSMYMTRGRYRVLTMEAKEFKQETADDVKKIITKKQMKELEQADRIRVCISVVSDNWYTKSGSIRKKDIENLAKCTNDAIFDALTIDDSKIFELTLKKEVGDSDIIKYEIWAIND